MKKSTHNVPEFASHTKIRSINKMQPVLHASRSVTSTGFVLGSSIVCLVGENLTYSVPAL